MISRVGILIAFVCFVLGYFSRFFKVTYWLVGGGLLWAICLMYLYKLAQEHAIIRNLQIVAWSLTLIGCVAICLAESLILSAMIEEAEGSPEVIVVLGAGLWGDQPSTILKSRLDKALETLEDKPNVGIVLSGGQGPDEWVSEARAMADYLIDRGIDEKRLYLEDQSTSTDENIRFSSELIEREFGRVPVWIITSDFHSFRTQMLADRENMTADVLNSETIEYLKLNYMLREALAIFKDLVI